MTTRITLEKVGNIIRSFLFKNGGMANGYVTFAEGTIRRDTSGILKISTPTTVDLTGREMNDLGREIYESIQKFLVFHDVRDHITIKAKAGDHGCYDMEVSITMSMPILMWNGPGVAKIL